MNPVIDDIRKTVDTPKLYVAFSGGLDSSVVAVLAKLALGPERVELVTTRFGFTYPKTVRVVREFSDRLGLRHTFVDGSEWQKKVWKSGPACNACTRGPKLQSVKGHAGENLVATGADADDTWGQQGLKCHGGLYSPIASLSREQVKKVAECLGIKPVKIGENDGREGCILKHLLKMMAVPEFHGSAVYESNTRLMELIESEKMNFSIANVKIVGPLSKNLALVNLDPLPPNDFVERVKKELSSVKTISKTEIVDSPVKLKIIANPGIYNNEKSRYWVLNGRLAPDFSAPISADWAISKNNRLSTFQIIDYEIDRS